MSLQKLNKTTVSDYNEAPLKVIQFGEGNFLRAFVDWIFDVMYEKGLFNGKVVMVQPIDKGLSDMVNRQDGLYHLFRNGYERGILKEDIRLIRIVDKCLNPYSNFEDYLSLAKVDSIDIIISNTTEAGIVFDSSDQFPNRPAHTFPGKLTQLLYERFKHCDGDLNRGFTIIPCELINKNADNLKKCIDQFIDHWKLGDDFKSWVEKANTFHNTLVDRIVPGYPKENADALKQKIGFDDDLMVAAEFFHLWVIEGDADLNKKIPFTESGLNVKLVDDITPYRDRKVKILNGAHTGMVPMSYLYGNRTVQETVETPFTKMFVEQLVYNEILPSVKLDEAERRQFAEEVLERFRNPSIKHLLASIALNSVSKFKVRDLPSFLEYYGVNDKLPKNLTFSLSALIRFYKGEWEGDTLPVNDDPEIMSFFKETWSSNNYDTISEKVLSQMGFWGKDLTTINGLKEAVSANLRNIDEHGIEGAYNKI